MRRCIAGLVVLGLSLLVPVQGRTTPAATRYALTDLGDVLPRAINDHGVVAGALQLTVNGTQVQHACRWQRGRTEDLGTLGGANSGANDINAGGQIAGWSETGEVTPGDYPLTLHRPVLWTGSQALPLDTASYLNDATGLNDRGQVAIPAGIWERRKVTPLLVNHDESAMPLDINNRGQMIAIVDYHGVDHLFVYRSLRSRNRTMFSLSNPTNPVCSINNKSWVAGTDEGNEFAFFWDGKDVTPLTARYAGEGTATGINDSNVIAGSFREAAVIWQRGVRVDLNGFLPAGSPWVLQNATGINNRGQIVGIGTFGGETHGFLLAPVGVR